MNHKEHFEIVIKACESRGLLPKGKAADLMEDYPFLLAEIGLVDEPSVDVDHDALDEQTKERARKS